MLNPDMTLRHQSSPLTLCDAHVQCAGSSVLVVFDFDWSLVEENSDTWVLQHLGAWDHFCRCLLLQLFHCTKEVNYTGT